MIHKTITISIVYGSEVLSHRGIFSMHFHTRSIPMTLRKWRVEPNLDHEMNQKRLTEVW
jgi:hypothetical protein